ncbi:WRP73 protein, partial [Polyodon spathula]|nr:WRP73 protein [Polyodon spathula]
MFKRGLVWSLEQPDWHCKIDEGSAGLVASRWSPDGRHILNTTEFHSNLLYLSVNCCCPVKKESPKIEARPLKVQCMPCCWGVLLQRLCFLFCPVQYIHWPVGHSQHDLSAHSWLAQTRPPILKYSLQKCQMRPRARALITRSWLHGSSRMGWFRVLGMSVKRYRVIEGCGSPSGLYVPNLYLISNTPRLVNRHFESETQDLAGIEWSPNGCVLAVWDTCLEYKVLLYSLDGRLLSTFSAYEWSLGVKSVMWSPSSQFLAIGSYDEKVRILNHVTWKKIIEFEHPATVKNPKTVVYKEVEKRAVLGSGDLSFHHNLTMGSSLFSTQSKYEVSPAPVQVPVIKPDPERANPKIGISTMAFSSDNRYLVTKNDNMPNDLWIWDMQKLKLFVVLEQAAPVRCFQWDPCRSRLAICTGNSKVYMWSPAGCVSVQVPVEGSFQVLSLNWHSSGESMVLLSKEQLCLCYMETPEEQS